MFASFTAGLSKLQQQVQEALPELQERLAEQIGQQFASLSSSLAVIAPAEELQLNSRRLRILQKLGEGGYSFVYLAEEILDQNGAPGRHFALKKVLAGGHESLTEARHEIEVMHRLQHPNLLQIIDSAVVSVASAAAGNSSFSSRDAGGASHVVYMLFPLYDTNMWDFVQQRLTAKTPLTSPEVVHIFSQLCAALQAMHAQGLSHRDVKLHNVLLRCGGPPPLPSRGLAKSNNLKSSTNAIGAADGSNSNSRTSKNVGGGIEQGTVTPKDGAHLVAQKPPALSSSTASAALDTSSNRTRLQQQKQQRHAVLMDFGSAGPSQVTITSRSSALALQEDAERKCTAPYRAPELWDVPSSCVIGPEVDIWAAGCVAYTMMVGETPFEAFANVSGGSLMLAVVNGKYTWPQEAIQRYPAELRELVDMCLNVEADKRPTAEDLVGKLQQLYHQRSLLY